MTEEKVRVWMADVGLWSDTLACGTGRYGVYLTYLFRD